VLLFLAPEYQREDYEAMTDLLRKYTRGLYLPEERGTSEAQKEKDSILNLKLAEKIEKLRELSVEEFFVQGMEGQKFNYLPLEMRNHLINEIRKQKRRMPPGGFQSLDIEVEDAHGIKTPMAEILTDKNDFLQSLPTEIEDTFTTKQQQQLEELLGKTGLKIFEFRCQHFEMAGERGEKKIIAKALEIAESTVANYIGTKNHEGIFETKANEILKILS